MLYAAEEEHAGRRPLLLSLERSPDITGEYTITLLVGQRACLVKIGERRGSVFRRFLETFVHILWFFQQLVTIQTLK